MPTAVRKPAHGSMRRLSTVGVVGITAVSKTSLCLDGRAARRIGGKTMSKAVTMRRPSSVRMNGPLTPYRAGFEVALARSGYSDLGAGGQLRLMSHLSRWMAERGVDPGGFDHVELQAFLAERHRLGYRQWRSTAGMRPLLDYLTSVGAVPAEAAPPDTNPAGRMVESYCGYLLTERSLAASTVRSYAAVARRFVGSCCGQGGDLGRVTPAAIGSFLVKECSASRAPTGLASALRCFLRYLFVESLLPEDLSRAVPPTANWSGASLPREAPPKAVAALLGACDRRRALGRRDYAMFSLMVRLGLRPAEVAGLEVDDLDWRAGDVLIRGKGRRSERLPLPADVGAAVASYLRRGRPRSKCRAVFLRTRAPSVGLGPTGVTAAVYRACDRAGIDRLDSRRLRHSAATQMLRSGASLAEVALVLRHHDLLTTTAYAKVDRLSLRELAAEWPEVDQ